MIAWSEAKLKVRVVQPRRLNCTHCGQPFVYLATDEFEKTVRGLPYASLLGGEEGRRRRLIEAVEGELVGRSLKGKGQATCPHCRYKLPWMEITRPQSIVGSGLVGLVVGAIVGWLVGLVAGWDVVPAIAVAAVIGAGLLGTFGSATDLAPKPTPDSSPKDLRSMDDSEWGHFIRAVMERRTDPGEAWWHLVLEGGLSKEGEAVIGLPPVDETITQDVDSYSTNQSNAGST